MKWYSFSEVVTDVTSKFKKIKASDYQTTGKYKIIDQGKEQIAGYTDDASLVNDQLLPILIFGDHTRILKFEDEPIALGADGAKALLVNSKLAITLYVYYYLRSVQIKEAGYSRHFKFLKEVRIPIPFKDGNPNLDDQKRIAHLLGKVEGLIAQRKQHLQQLDDLLKSVFLVMFGDPAQNEKGWKVVFWDDLFVTRTGKLNANAMSENGAYPFFTCAKEIFHIDNFAFDCEALILAGNNATGDYDVKHYEGKFNAYQRTYILELKSETDSYLFYKHHLEMKLRQLKDGSKGANTRYLTKQFLDTICFIRPGEELQKRFAAIHKKIGRVKSRYQQSLTDLENLYGALSQQAFKGELDLSRVPLPDDDGEAQEQIAQPHEERTTSPATFQLPEPPEDGELLAVENLKPLIEFWLNAWCDHYASESFSAMRFIESAYQRLTELLERKAFRFNGEPSNGFDSGEWYQEPAPFGTAEYEQIKEWVFAQLESGYLQQTLDRDNRTQLTRTEFSAQ